MCRSGCRLGCSRGTSQSAGRAPAGVQAGLWEVVLCREAKISRPGHLRVLQVESWPVQKLMDRERAQERAVAAESCLPGTTRFHWRKAAICLEPLEGCDLVGAIPWGVGWRGMRLLPVRVLALRKQLGHRVVPRPRGFRLCPLPSRSPQGGGQFLFRRQLGREPMPPADLLSLAPLPQVRK